MSSIPNRKTWSLISIVILMSRLNIYRLVEGPNERHLLPNQGTRLRTGLTPGLNQDKNLYHGSVTDKDIGERDL